ncbi:MAG TPA: DUF429 domain-containing protein [Acidimicrobiales bacterium]|nr:DUF429 domain-containing protein [Acidimicrobiales bacterium]
MVPARRPPGLAGALAGRPVAGIDLAWGRRNRTGLCAVRPDGTVISSASVLSDDEIVEWILKHSASPAVVGFDAPIVVDNPTGRRPCETLVSRAFGAQKAGCHSSNRSMAVFADGGRARALARRLDLCLDPNGCTQEVGLAAEVYPHAAVVALFGLAERIPYKAGRGRSLEDRRAALGHLVTLVESLVDGDPPLDVPSSPRWAGLLAAVDGAATHRALDEAEDEIDAYVCAYVALCLASDLGDGGRRVDVMGEWAAGAIVTPAARRQLAVTVR